jgi:hypothetical protein
VLDFVLIATLGFLGSFGHCLGMCGPLTVAFSLSQAHSEMLSWRASLSYHILLNLGRISSYALVGAAIGGASQLLIHSGQLTGVGSQLRHGIAILTGLLLIGFGLKQIKPDLLPSLPIFHPLQGKLHQRLSAGMLNLSMALRWWTPLLLGLCWGLMPCGFLYVAQLKAIAQGNWMLGAATLLAFGLGTMPTLLGIGISASRLSASTRSQLFRLGGWITLAIGILTLLRTDRMVDITGHAALLLLMLALIARPISRIWSAPLRYRRALGVGAFIIAVAHALGRLEHTFEWNLAAIPYLVPQHQIALAASITALLLMVPVACTSSDYWQKLLGSSWRKLHLLAVPALVLVTIHAILIGSDYLGELGTSGGHQGRAIALVALTLAVLLLRWGLLWSLLSLDRVYVHPPVSKRSRQSGVESR